MSVFWLTPSAWFGLVALVVPIVIHLLTRQHTPVVRFPTLRFIRPTRLAALRRRRLEDVVLLGVRLAALTAAVAALATPVFVSATRQQQWRARIARAVVIAPIPAQGSADADTIIRSEQGGSFVNAVFRPSARVADGIRDAAMWLDRQPPASREIVIVGTLREGALSAADIAIAPSSAGIRFVPVDIAATPRDVDFRLLHNGGTLHVRTTLLEQSTRITVAADTDAPPPITVLASAADQTFASAALDAALSRGVRLPQAGARSLRVIFAGAPIPPAQQATPPPTLWMREALAQLPEVEGARDGDTLIIRTSLRANSAEAARLLARAVHAVYDEDVSGLEPNVMSPAQLTRWSRPVGFDPARPADEGDRRWFWAVALGLLGIEALIRRPRSTTKHEESGTETQVA